MKSNQLKSQFVLIDAVASSDNQTAQFGQNIKWVADDIFTITGNISKPWVTNNINFTDGTYFDGGSSTFGQELFSGQQKIDVFQLLTTKRTWINSSDDILQPVVISTIPVNGPSTSQAVYSGAINNLFLSDSGNPQKSIKILNNPQLSHGWTVFTAQESQIDPGSISRAWIYDSITNIKLADLEVVDLYAGILPGTIASELDYVCDIDPARYNTPIWKPGAIYNIGDRVMYGGQLFQALYAGKSGTIFNQSLWTLIATENINNQGNIKWGANQVGKTWFKTANLKTINAQLGTLSERSLNWNQWFPNTVIEVYEWINSSVPPANFINSSTSGYVLDVNCSYAFDSASNLYGFWVYAKNSIGPLHNQTTAQLIADLSNIPGTGIPMITAIGTNAVAVWNINQFVSNNTVILHIDYVTESADNELHNEFALISNDGSKSWYDTTIYPKMIDSLCGISTTNQTDQLVPDYTLPLSQQTGILNKPLQSLFVNRVEALQIYFSVINQQLSNLAIATSSVISALSVFDPLPTTGFDEQISNRNVLSGLNPILYPENYRILLTIDNTITPSCWSIVANINSSWQIVQHQLYNLTNNWEYSDWFGKDYTSTSPTYTFSTPGQLNQIVYNAGDIVKVLDDGNGNETIYLAVVNDIDSNVIELEPIYLQNGTIQFLPNLYNFEASEIGFDAAPFDSQGFDNDPYLPIRLITQILNDTIFVGSDSLLAAADNSFYSLLNYIFYENKNLDWLFKTSFITVDYNNRNLDIQGNYEPDNQSSIEDFVNETLPFHTRIREFRDIYSGNDYGNIGAIDFDLPAQFDSNYENEILTFSANPKLNANLPLNQFTSAVGVALDKKSFYIRSNGLPAIIPPSNSYPATKQTWKFGLPLNAKRSYTQYNTASNINGPIAVAINGVPMFGPNSGQTETLYLNSNVDIQQTFTINSVWSAINNSNLDPGAGFANVTGAFGYYSNPYLIYNQPVGGHSPILGYAWDGLPIYGPYGFANADGSGGIIRNTSSYQLSLTPRLDKTGMPITNGIQLAQYQIPTGEYIEDFIYVLNSGTLDNNNGRFVVTPEYPNGVYAYFTTIDSTINKNPIYPYIVGPNYYAKPFGLQYIYINGINTPVYPNGSVDIPNIPTIDTVELVRSPDGSVDTDTLTLQLPSYSAWNNNHTYSLGGMIVEKSGEGFLDLSANIVITPTNNASAFASGLCAVFATMLTGGNSYFVDDILVLNGGTFSNAAQFQVTSVNVLANNAINTFTVLKNLQNYTILPANIANVSVTSLTSNGSGASFNVVFGLNSIEVDTSGTNFITTPTITVTDANASIQAVAYPIMENSLIRQIDTTLRFDRVNSTVEFITANIAYPLGAVVYDNANSIFVTSIVANANSSTLGNANFWTPASNTAIDLSTAVNRIAAFYAPNSNMYANISRLLMTGVEYSGVLVDTHPFLESYVAPSGSIFDQDDGNIYIPSAPWPIQPSLNISFAPNLLTDSALTNDIFRFGNMSGSFRGDIPQYIFANSFSPDISDLNIGTKDFTLEFFTNFSNLNNSINVLVDTRSDIGSANGVVIYCNQGNICIGSNTNISIISTKILPSTNEWNYFTLNGNVGNLYAYFNGQLFGTANIQYNFTDTSFTLGADIGGGNVMTGYMDELRLTTQFNRYSPGVIDISVPVEKFSRTKQEDIYFQNTPILWGFESFKNEGASNIVFNSANSQIFINDLSWNKKKLQVVNYGTQAILDGNILNSNTVPEIGKILSLKLNQG